MKNRSSTSAFNAEAPRGSWFRFWFQPNDPTVLGFMRIITGLVVIYIHLAYCFDLEAFFGPNGWWDIEVAQRERKEHPVNVNDWTDEDPKPSLSVPFVYDQRIAVFDFLKHLPEDKNERDKVLRYAYFALDQTDNRRLSEKDYQQAFSVLMNLRTLSAEQKTKMIAELGKKDYNGQDDELTLPEVFKQMSPEERLQRWNDAQYLASEMPVASTYNLPYVLTWFQRLSPPERKTLSDFLHALPDGPESRRIIDYNDLWRQDPRLVYSKGRSIFSLWFHVGSPATMWTCHILFLGIFFLFTIGFCTRVTSVLTWLATLSYIHRTNHVLFGMDTMMNILLFYLMIGPSGAALSVDRLILRYRAAKAILRGSGKPVPWAEAALAGPLPSPMANLAIRLVQIHYCFMYLAAGLAKLKGTMWWNGYAAWLTIANPEFCPVQFSLYEKILFEIASMKLVLAFLLAGMVYFTLFMEISLPFLVWTRFRPIIVIGSIFFHTGIAWIMGLTCFGLFMMTLLLGFFPASVVRERIGWPPGAGAKITVRFNSRDKRHRRSISLLRAFDVSGQLVLVDEPAKNGFDDAPLQVVGPDGQTKLDYEGVLEVLRTLVLGKNLTWMLWIPGISALLRRLTTVGGYTTALERQTISEKAKTPASR